MGKLSKCEKCNIDLVWEHPGPGIGRQYCPICYLVYSQYNCPWIPVDIKDELGLDKTSEIKVNE